MLVMFMLQPVKGTRDFIGEDAALRQFLLDVIRRAFERYGFMPMDTPAFEYLELLSKKSGEDIEKEIYSFKDKSGRALGLRFDLTVPMARVVASQKFKKPFKRYQIGKVWRYDQPQAARWREFMQADIDIVGSTSPLADLECLKPIVDIFKELGLEFSIKINNRKILESVVRSFGIENIPAAFRIIDKQDKIGWDEVKKELRKSFPDKDVEELVDVIKKNDLASLQLDKEGEEGLRELKALIDLAKAAGIDSQLKTDISLVRGLEYYTGNVFEIMAGLNVSVGGGGRYDNLTEILGGEKEPATGMSIGVDRLVKVLQDKKFTLPKKKKVYVAPIGEATGEALRILDQLRASNIISEIDMMGRSLSKQLEATDADTVIIVGPKDLASRQVTIRNMETGEEKKVAIDKIVEEVMK